MPHIHSPARANARRLLAVLGLSIGILVIELVGGIASNSLALLADAGHVFTDVAGIEPGAAGDLVRGRGRPAASGPSATCGSRSWPRSPTPSFCSRSPRSSSTRRGADSRLRPRSRRVSMLAVARRRPRRQRHRAVAPPRRPAQEPARCAAPISRWPGDAAGSVAVIVAAVVIAVTGRTGADALASALIALLILPRTWGLLRDAIDVLLEATPKGVEMADVRAPHPRCAGCGRCPRPPCLVDHVRRQRRVGTRRPRPGCRAGRECSTSCASACPGTSTSSIRPSSSSPATGGASRRGRTGERERRNRLRAAAVTAEMKIRRVLALALVLVVATGCTGASTDASPTPLPSPSGACRRRGSVASRRPVLSVRWRRTRPTRLVLRDQWTAPCSCSTTQPGRRSHGRRPRADGTFFAELPAGDYVVTPQPAKGLLGTPGPQSVTVPGGAIVRLDLAYDAGSADRRSSGLKRAANRGAVSSPVQAAECRRSAANAEAAALDGQLLIDRLGHEIARDGLVG